MIPCNFDLEHFFRPTLRFFTISRFVRTDPGSTAILANAPATLAEYSVSAVFCPISVQYRKPIKSRFTDADVSGYAAGIGEMQLSEI
jgi:hypothetical protein